MMNGLIIKEMVSLINSKNSREFVMTFYIVTSLILPFAVFNYLNIQIWNVDFNPVDFILKPFMIIPLASLLLALLTEWIINAFHFTKQLSLKIRNKNGRLSIKLVQKSLPIYMVDENYFKEEAAQMRSQTIVDMRIRDRKKLPFHHDLNVITLYSYDNEVNINYLVEKANLLVQNTAFKNKPITFIIDSKKEKNRTISKIWLRLICNPKSKSADSDIHTILDNVYT